MIEGMRTAVIRQRPPQRSASIAVQLRCGGHECERLIVRCQRCFIITSSEQLVRDLHHCFGVSHRRKRSGKARPASTHARRVNSLYLHMHEYIIDFGYAQQERGEEQHGITGNLEKSLVSCWPQPSARECLHCAFSVLNTVSFHFIYRIRPCARAEGCVYTGCCCLSSSRMLPPLTRTALSWIHF